MRTTRSLVRAAFVVAAVVASASPAGAGAPAAPVTATLTGGAAGTYRACDGTTQVTGTGIHLQVSRTGVTTASVAFDLTWGGTLVGGTDYQAPPSTGTIPVGEVDAPSIDLAPLTDKAGTVTVDVTGPGITPVHAELTTTTVQVPNCSTLDPIHQVVEVGSPISIPVGDIAPYVAPLVHDVQLQVVGALPPGTRFSDDFYPADRKLVGTPTTVGTSTFSLQACAGSCRASQTFIIDVVPVGTGPTPAPTSTAGAGAPSAAATPVAAVPTYTG